MKAWRICKQAHQATAFTGIGAQHVGGRWHFKGHPVVYCSENLSLAALEVFVYLEPSMLPEDLVSLCVEFPDTDSVETIEAETLPENWRRYPGPDELKQLGLSWLQRRSSVVLRAPSAVNPQEYNLLLNPNHPEMGELGKPVVRPFHYDPRLFGKSE